MKTSIRLFLIAAITIQSAALMAKTTHTGNGIYLTENDYRTHHLSYELTNTDKLHLNDFLEGAHIHFTSDGKAYELAKNNVFGYRQDNQDYRFDHNKAYRILDTAGFLMYSKTILIQEGKGMHPVTGYFFSTDGKAGVQPLTLTALSGSFSQQTAFCYSIRSYFKDDAELGSYDQATKQFRIKYLYFQSKAVLARRS